MKINCFIDFVLTLKKTFMAFSLIAYVFSLKFLKLIIMKGERKTKEERTWL